ncbi:hypothetical protein NFI96_010188 [Prochilodus magdalenae]|nr:hypothetical protein NFI96_010188 [Prochilodus magdalenae]
MGTSTTSELLLHILSLYKYQCLVKHKPGDPHRTILRLQVALIMNTTPTIVYSHYLMRTTHREGAQSWSWRSTTLKHSDPILAWWQGGGNQFHPEHSVQAAPAPNTSQSANRACGNQFHPEHSVQAAPAPNTSQSANGNQEEWSDTESTSSDDCYENVGMEAEAFVQTYDSSTSSDDTYENVPDIDEDDCQSSSSHDYDDVSNW